MTRRAEEATASAPRSALVAVGAVVLSLALVAVLGWGLSAWFTSDLGAKASESIAGQMVEVGVQDPQGAPEVWQGLDEQHQVIWEGTRAELDALEAEGRALYQEHLRQQWLFPALAVAALGVGLVLVGEVRRRRDTTHAVARSALG